MENIAALYGIFIIIALVYAIWLLFVPLIICKKMDKIIELLKKKEVRR